MENTEGEDSERSLPTPRSDPEKEPTLSPVADGRRRGHVRCSLTALPPAPPTPKCQYATGATATCKILAFKEMPDFEMPGDQNKDNVYEVTVRASDGELTADRMMTIKITDADEDGRGGAVVAGRDDRN